MVRNLCWNIYSLYDVRLNGYAVDKSIMTDYVTPTIDVYRNDSFIEILTHRMNSGTGEEVLCQESFDG